jgi:hypothetical protein
MAKTQTRLKQRAAEPGKRANPFQLVRQGEPLPPIASEKVRIPAPNRSRARRAQPSLEPDCCPLCGGIIARFDAEVFLAYGRCAPCHEVLTEP